MGGGGGRGLNGWWTSGEYLRRIISMIASKTNANDDTMKREEEREEQERAERERERERERRSRESDKEGGTEEEGTAIIRGNPAVAENAELEEG